MKRGFIARRCFAGIGFFIVTSLVFGFVVMWLWNSLIPPLFHGPLLTYWQAVGILILAKILFRGIGRGHGDPHGREHDWRRRFEEKLAAMSPEEREQCRSRWGSYCGWGTGEKSEIPKG